MIKKSANYYLGTIYNRVDFIVYKMWGFFCWNYKLSKLFLQSKYFDIRLFCGKKEKAVCPKQGPQWAAFEFPAHHALHTSHRACSAGDSKAVQCDIGDGTSGLERNWKKEVPEWIRSNKTVHSFWINQHFFCPRNSKSVHRARLNIEKIDPLTLLIYVLKNPQTFIWCLI